ncbi:hypothetical protein Q73A0000_10230 [Kaistella flava (ex Peng et al. 2021)]|uniref:Uncharacterized protein n=1 Tax=Kaistella flava (ex Peng et al. 2021) TaxID=2038776 RepID=A0A7M2Y9A6_9FLAO|nr:hypothetical protein [Kaistella flava (ex Peng et al. 2021)]QOW10721.1 hypothetical protein Q73A0000_10230 [Kaistella flava (ex Peng et al. 2021)]
MKKILLGLSVFLMTLVSAQNYPDSYPNNNGSGVSNYGDNDDEFYFPDDYYYQYPADYYTSDLYKDYYNDYRKSIYDVNWNQFFAAHRLSPYQVRQIMMLNDRYPTYASWNSYYQYNPDRWYYDRFYAIQRILGPSIFLVFQNNYYHGYSPVVYYQNYNRRHYARNVYVVPRYRNININVYRVNKVQYHQSNPRQNIGFQPVRRSGQTANSNGTRDNGFRNNGVNPGNSSRNNSIRPENNNSGNNGVRNQMGNTRNNNVRSESQPRVNNGGLRNNTESRQESPRNSTPTRRMESNSGNRGHQNMESRTPSSSSSSRNSGHRFTAR